LLPFWGLLILTDGSVALLLLLLLLLLHAATGPVAGP